MNREHREHNERDRKPVEIPQWLSKEIRSRISISPELEKLIFVGVINRTNTGALTTAIGKAPSEKPITRHIQPVKAISRRLVSERSGIDSSTPLVYLKDTIEIGDGVQLVKETIGPNFDNPAEWLDAMKFFIEAGVAPKKIVFIPTLRNPLDVFLSWKRMWKWDLNNFPFDSFNYSYKKTLEMLRFAQRMGITVVPYIHEFLRDFGAENTLGLMMYKAGLPFDKSMVSWSENDDAYWQGKIVKYDVPPNDWIEGSLSVAKGGRGGLIWKPVPQSEKISSTEERIVMQKIIIAEKIYNEIVALAKEQ